MRPFPGLRPFGFEDREFFFGREDQIYSLYRLLEHSRFIAVVGSSGSGKSSLVRAGLLPVIEEESQGDGGRKWRFATLHPGDAPVKALAEAVTSLAQVSGEDAEIRNERALFTLRRSSFGLTKALDEIPVLAGKSVLLVVDQFEELFRYATSTPRDRAGNALWRDEATNFVQLLLEATRSRSSSIYVLITMRSDFIGDCSQFHGLPEAVSAAQFLVPSLTRDQREDVIRKPVEKVGATIDSTLVEMLLNDASSEMDQLPVLQHCLSRLWDRAAPAVDNENARNLGLDEYRAIGGISGALSQHADEVMASVPGLELAVEQVFRALSEIDKEGRATRRALPLHRLHAEAGVPKGDLLRVLDRFRAEDCSFILPPPSAVSTLRNDSRVDVVHEALLRRWERISSEEPHVFDGRLQTGWLAAEAADGRFYRAMLALLETESGPGKVTLPLDQVEARWHWWNSRPRTEAWAERYGGRLKSVQKLFVDSLAALEADRARQEEAERREREQERRKIEAEEAAKRERLEHEAEVDRMRAESAQRLTHQTRIAALAMSLIALIAIVLAIDAWQKTKIAYYATGVAQTKQKQFEDQRNRANNEASNAIYQTLFAQWDTAVARVAQGNAEQQKHVAEQQRQNAEQQRVQALSERSQVFLQVGRQALLNGNDSDAALLLAAAYTGDQHNPFLQLMLSQALDKLAMRPAQMQAPDKSFVTALAFNPNSAKGQIATASTSGSARILDSNGRLIREFSDQGDSITALAFDPAGRYLVTVGRDGSAKLHDLQAMTAADPASIALRDPANQLEGHAARVNSVVFSHDGKRILTSGNDGKVKVWSTANGELLLAWDGAKPGVAVNNALFTLTDQKVITCAVDGSLAIWNAGTGAQISAPTITSKSPLVRLALSGDGETVAAGALDGTLVLYGIQSGQVIERHDQHGAITSLSFDATGRRLLSTSEDGSALLVDPATGQPERILAARPGAPAVLTGSFNRSGGVLETTYGDGWVNLWTAQGEPIAAFSSPSGKAVAAAFSPEGGWLVTGGDDGSVYRWRSASDLLRAAFSHRGAVSAVEFDRTGGRALTASKDGTAVIWRIGETLREEQVLPHAPGRAWVVAAHFSADSQRIVTAGGNTVKIWGTDSTPAQPLTTIHTTAPQKRFTTAAFVGNSANVIVAQTDTRLSNPDKATDGWSVWSAGGIKLHSQSTSGYQTGIREIALSRDQRSVLAIGAHGSATFVSSDGEQWYKMWDGTAEGIAVPEGFIIGGASSSGNIHILNDEGTDVVRPWASKDQRVVALASSQDGRWLASGGNGGTLGTIWDLSRPGSSKVPLGGGEGQIVSASFSPRDSIFLMAICSDGSVKLWDRASGDQLASISLPGSRPTAAAFTPDGSALVIGAQNGAMFLWQLRRGIPAPRDLAALVLRESDLSSISDPLMSQAINVLRNLPAH